MSNVYHKGDLLFLYAKFKDELGNPIQVNNPMVRIVYENNGDMGVLLDWQPLLKMGVNEYFLNYPIPNNIKYSLHEIIYSGEYDGKIARMSESFYVLPNSDIYKDVIKIYGFINQSRVGYPLIGAKVKIFNDDSLISEGFSNEEGKWGLYAYPGKYKFVFEKYGFKSEEFSVDIGTEYNEMQFDNIALESVNDISKGNGAFVISDKYITREGIPLNGLNVKAYDVFAPEIVVAGDVTNDDGEWRLFLDSGMYLLKVNGNSLMDDFNQIFRLKVEESGEFKFENLTQNIAIPVENNFVGNGNSVGNIEVTDHVLDGNGNPIVDVQLSVYLKSDLNKLIAEDYTDPTGRWKVFLNPGIYVFEFYHPEFHEFSEERKV